MSLLIEFDREIEKDREEINSKIIGLHSDLIRASPVDTGEFRGAWKLKNNSRWSWTIENNQKYASILSRGRRYINGVWYGSEQWSEGLTPMIMRFEESL